MYAKPNVRPLDAATALSSCTPCTVQKDSHGDPTYLYVTPAYSQVGDQGFCYPGLPVRFMLEVSPGASVAHLIW